MFLLSLMVSVVGVGFFSSHALAADEKGLYQTMHFISCEDYVVHRKEPLNTGMNAVDMIYVSGWLSGYNYLTPNTYNIVPDQNIHSVMIWLDGYCKKYPKKNIESGLLKLTDDLYPKRIKSYAAPKDAAKPAEKKK
jgi:hypothetical protein